METFNPLCTFILMYLHESKKIVQLEKGQNGNMCLHIKRFLQVPTWLQFVNPFENIFMTGGIKSGKTDLTLLFSTYSRVQSLISL